MQVNLSLDHIVDRLGRDDFNQARVAVEVIASQLMAHSGASCLGKLTAGLGTQLPVPDRVAIELDELYALVAERMDLPVGEVVELTQIVLSEIADVIGPDGVSRIGPDLPPAWGPLLEPPQVAALPASSRGMGVAPHSAAVARGEHARGRATLGRGRARIHDLATGRVDVGKTVSSG